MLADAMLENRAIKDVLSKKVLTPAARRKVVVYLQGNHQFSEQRACEVVGLCRSSCRYQVRLKNDEEIRARRRELAEQLRKFGVRTMLLREGYQVNHTRMERLSEKKVLPSLKEAH